MAEWFKALVLKTSEGNTSVSSNLTASATPEKALAERVFLYPDPPPDDPDARPPP